MLQHVRHPPLEPRAPPGVALQQEGVERVLVHGGDVLVRKVELHRLHQNRNKLLLKLVGKRTRAAREPTPRE